VADGAVSFFIDHLVSSRTARFTYGTECNALYNEHDPEHVARRDNAFEGMTGYLEVPHAFESILKKVSQLSLLCEVFADRSGPYTKGTEVSEEQEFKKPFIIEEFDLSHCGSIHVDIVAYRGKLLDPSWVDTERGEFVANSHSLMSLTTLVWKMPTRHCALCVRTRQSSLEACSPITSLMAEELTIPSCSTSYCSLA
jgi:hypothetical protein